MPEANKYIEEITHIDDNYKLQKEKTFYNHFKIEAKTKSINTVINDNLTPTMYAYYFCNKMRVNLSDKEAAAFSAMNINNSEEEDKKIELYSNNSNSNSVNNLSLYNQEPPRLKKKRKNSSKLTRRDNRKPRNSARNQDNDEDESFIQNSLYRDDNDDEEDKVLYSSYLGILYIWMFE
jgi:hypothetical protein